MNDDRLVRLLSDLIALPSVNPIYDPASPGEAAVAGYVAAWAEGIGLPVRRQEVFPGRANVVVRLDGPATAPVLLMEAHMDTVGVSEMPDAFIPALRDGCLYGRGACDTKGSLAAMMAAVEALAADRDGLACSVELLAAVDEETSGQGARAHVRAGNTADAAIVGEPTGLRVVNRHNGVVRGKIVGTGKAAHTSVAAEGVNAIEGMAEVIIALREVNATLTNAPGGQPANGSLTVSLVSGGSGINVVPETCVIQYDRRIVPGQTAAHALAEIDAALDLVCQARPDVRIAREEPWLVGDALSTGAGEAIVAAAVAASGALGLDPEPAYVPYGSDASKFASGGIPTIVFGPGSIAHAHSATERVPAFDLVQAAAFYREVACHFGAN